MDCKQIIVTLCVYAQQGYAFGRVGLCAYYIYTPMKPYNTSKKTAGVYYVICSLGCRSIFPFDAVIYCRMIEVHMVSFLRALCHQVSLNRVFIAIEIHYTTPTLSV